MNIIQERKRQIQSLLKISSPADRRRIRAAQKAGLAMRRRVETL